MRPSSVLPGPAAVPSAEAAGGRWKPRAVAVACFVGAIGLNVLHVPGNLAAHWVPMFLLVTGCMAAVRWRRAGVRSELRSHAAQKIASYGGGVYGAIAMATLVQLETVDMVSDVVGTGSVAGFFNSLSLGWLVSQAVESVLFAVRAGLWPWHWFSAYGIGVVLIAAGAACGLDTLLRASIPRYRAMRAEQEARKAMQAA